MAHKYDTVNPKPMVGFNKSRIRTWKFRSEDPDFRRKMLRIQNTAPKWTIRYGTYTGTYST